MYRKFKDFKNLYKSFIISIFKIIYPCPSPYKKFKDESVKISELRR